MTVNHECSVVMRKASVTVKCMRRYLKQREGNNNAIVQSSNKPFWECIVLFGDDGIQAS